MKNEPIKPKLSPAELPEGFAYPTSFENYLQHQEASSNIAPWAITADSEANIWHSEQFCLPLVQFAQAWHEDMTACFVVDKSKEYSVIVTNPWGVTLVDDEWKETGAVIQKLPNFDSWLTWVKHSDLVKLYAESSSS